MQSPTFITNRVNNIHWGRVAIRDISRSCLDPNDFAVLNCIVKGHASLSPPSLRLRLCSRFTLLAFGEIFGHMAREASLHPISGNADVERQCSFHASM
ncbi:hypothetical protein TNCV_2317331 [Trichonephila clavipes]|nr:hypothetical protein TNCV_2317331 [Trichonephila clavipes]